MNSTPISNYINTLFPQFEPALRTKLIEEVTIKHFKAGEHLMQTGQYFRSTVLIVEGRVKLYREGTDGNEFFMYYLQPGEACALSMICAAKQESSKIMGKAIEDSTILMVPIALMDDLMKQYPSWYYFVMETYRARFEELLQVIDGIAFNGLDERLSFYLQKQAEQLETNQLNLTHQEIASDLNSSREVISRLLKKMEQKGEIKLFRNYIELKK
ncbi:Crp/Fnr family transcriptional regulator [Pedobacter gandavensis]|uniref:Helix-turn-helix domain-containing protein n=1 Tax=Pedobacter gandavensis TaxID=2679963 RepID=A0ABR6EV65_9SPHI|nr:Crp/Fnr family transcriptional regulator [Pedobacter gandavensis]MBB2149081.1 helix-turn-helix domain-containing protein [Pedobacter gandavensis]